MSNQPEGRGASSLTRGTKLSLTLAICSLAVAVYFYTASTHFVGRDGGLFGCGSPLSPNGSALAKGQCSILESDSLHKALLFLALALILAVLGFVLFGAPRTGGESRRTLDEGDDAGSARATRRSRLGEEDAPVETTADAPETRRARHADNDDETPTRRRLARLDED